MKKAMQLAVVTVLTLGVASTSRAQTTADEFVDMGAFTCEQLLAGTSDLLLTAVWLSGYYNGLRKNTKLSFGKLRHNSEMIAKECQSNPKQTVMQTVDKILSGLQQ